MIGLPFAVRAGQNSQSPVNLGKAEVAGTRIKRTEIEKAQPVVLHISRKQIENSGLASIGQLLQRLSPAGSAANRQLNDSGTGVGLQMGISERADLNTIPTIVIDPIDALKDGASAVYGADAIAGVVSIIPYRIRAISKISLPFGRCPPGRLPAKYGNPA